MPNYNLEKFKEWLKDKYPAKFNSWQEQKYFDCLDDNLQSQLSPSGKAMAFTSDFTQAIQEYNEKKKKNSEEILETWTSLKAKVESLNFMINKITSQTILPSFPLNLDSARQNLTHWTSHQFINKIEKEKQKILELDPDSEITPLVSLKLSHLNVLNMFINLTEGWRREKDVQEDSKNDLVRYQEVLTNILESQLTEIESSKFKHLINQVNSQFNLPKN